MKRAVELDPVVASRAVRFSVLAPVIFLTLAGSLCWIGGSTGMSGLFYLGVILGVGIPFGGLYGLVLLRAWRRLILTVLIAGGVMLLAMLLSGVLLTISKWWWVMLLPLLMPAFFVYLMTDGYVMPPRPGDDEDGSDKRHSA